MGNSISQSVSKCRLCGHPTLREILDLGDQPPANSLRQSISESLAKVPLVVCRCDLCSTIQLTETVSPEYLFRDYVWVTGTSQTAREYSHIFTDNVESRCSKESLNVVEIASNDGTFLKAFQDRGHRVLGIDPAQNLACLANAAGIKTEVDFFGLDAARKSAQANGLADVVIARNVLPHVPDPNDFIAGIYHLLDEEGIGVVEFHWAQKILAELHYDSIYHEHYFYHTLISVQQLLSRHLLFVFDVSESPISGGSLVVYFSKREQCQSDTLKSKLDLENRLGLSRLATWNDFASRCLEHRAKLKALIEKHVVEGKIVIGYGASARSSTLMNFCGISNQHLACIADQNERKHGLYTPGTDILIVSPQDALDLSPNTILLLGWNFRDEIVRFLREVGFRGDIIIPLPGDPQVVGL